MHAITNGDARILIDCGLFQGRRDEYYEKNNAFPFDPSGIETCVLSHAHIDHSGNLPNLVKQGFEGKIVATNATADLCSAMLPDSGHIQEEDVKYVNKIHKRKGLPPRRPLYTQEEAESSLKYFSGVPYRETVAIADGCSATFYDAGHVLGSAIPLIELASGGRTIRVAYAVDLGRKNLPILKDPETPSDIDYLLLESTYGGRLHDSVDQTKDRLARIVTSTVEHGGKIIIPSFALERTQEVVYYLNQLLIEDRIPDIPICVDSPLAVNITDIFMRHPECFDEEMYEMMRNGDDPLGCRRIQYIRDVQESKALNHDPQPRIIISASGMCEAGRILHHLKNNIGDPKNTVLVVGYMARHTLGRRIVERRKHVKIFGDEYRLRARVEVMNAFSAHADRNEILDYIAPLKKRVKNIFIVHGDEDQSEKLLETLKEKGFPAHLPVPGEEVTLA
jgi:metallo-beta-lactamase family protein